MNFILSEKSHHRLLNLLMEERLWDAVFNLVRAMIDLEMTVPVKAYQKILQQDPDRFNPEILEEIKSSYSFMGKE